MDNYQRFNIQNLEPDEIEQNDSTQSVLKHAKSYNIGNCTLLCYPQFILAGMSGTIGYFLYGFMEPILAYRLQEFNLT